MPDKFDIHSLHGAYFIATICFDEVVGRVSVNENGSVYLVQNEYDGGAHCADMMGYKHAWYLHDIYYPKNSEVYDLKILPSPIEYHALFQEILTKRGPTWDVDGSYSVIPNEVLSKINDFMEGIKEFDAKNLGNNQNQS